MDLIVDDTVLVEIKAIRELENSHYKQVLNYLNVFDLEVGLLINFGAESLQFKRLIRSKQSAKSSSNPKISDICLSHYRTGWKVPLKT